MMEQNRNKIQAELWVGLRRCLCCGGRFVALSPYVRVCDPCKASEEWQSGNVDIVRHGSGTHSGANPANDN
jgi:hypothetical protein